MILWRDGKAGFVGASKRIIKGFFSYSYTSPTANITIVVPAERVYIVAAENRTEIIAAENREEFINPERRTQLQ